MPFKISYKSSREINADELKFSREQSFFDRSVGLRFFIGLAFATCVFFFVHCREIRVEMLEVSKVAPKYVVAEVDFSFQDEEATAILRQEALLDVGKIYLIDPDEVRNRRVEFENYLIYSNEWRKLAKNSTFEEMYRGIDHLEKTLFDLRFTDPRTLQKLKETHFSVANYHELAPFDQDQGAYFPGKVWETIRQLAFRPQSFASDTTNFVIKYFESKIWKLKEDSAAARKLRKAIQAQIPPKFTQVAAGSRIIDQGEKVTSRHIAMLQAMKWALSEKRNLWHSRTIAGSALLTVVVLLVGYAYLSSHQRDVLISNRRLFLLVTIVMMGILMAKIAEFFLMRSSQGLVELVRYPLLTPFVSILLCSLINPGIAIFVSALLTTLFESMLAFERQGFMLTNLIVALVAVMHTRSLRKRTEIFAVCTKAWFACCGLILAFYLYDQSKWSVSVLADLFSSGLFMLITAVIVVGILPLFESLFHIMTDITLMEYMDPNHELLRRLSVEAPGTYQHSLIVGSLSEAAAQGIGANGLFCRVATLYHDIGKMTTAHYFTENQQGGMNIHQLLTPVESAQVIISHVGEGVALARKAGLPEQFIDIIKEHHGTSQVYYFYHKQLEKMGCDKKLVNEKEFRYSGPKPRSKESVIIMIADTLEAASRSLDETNEKTLNELIDNLVRCKMEDGQFDESLVTFEELTKIKHILVKSLLAAGHFRIKYPPRQKKEVVIVPQTA